MGLCIRHNQGADALQVGRHLPEHFQPLAAYRRLEILEPRNISARPRKACDEAGFNRLGNLSEYDGERACQPVKLREYRIACGDNGIGCGLHRFQNELCGLLGVARAPPIFYSYIAVSIPAQICKCFEESCNACLTRLVTLGIRPEQHADTPHTLALLRTRDKRPRHHAAKKCDEFAPLHTCLPPRRLNSNGPIPF